MRVTQDGQQVTYRVLAADLGQLGMVDDLDDPERPQHRLCPAHETNASRAALRRVHIDDVVDRVDRGAIVDVRVDAHGVVADQPAIPTQRCGPEYLLALKLASAIPIRVERNAVAVSRHLQPVLVQEVFDAFVEQPVDRLPGEGQAYW